MRESQKNQEGEDRVREPGHRPMGSLGVRTPQFPSQTSGAHLQLGERWVVELLDSHGRQASQRGIITLRGEGRTL